MPGSDLGMPHTLSHVNITMILEVGMVAFSLHMRKLSFIEVEDLVYKCHSHD